VVVTERGRKLEQRGFGLVDEDEFAYAQPDQPRTELSAERPSGTGDKYGRFGDVLGKLPVADIDYRATEQRLEGDVFGTQSTVPCPRTVTCGRVARRLLSTRAVSDGGYVTQTREGVKASSARANPRPMPPGRGARPALPSVGAPP